MISTEMPIHNVSREYSFMPLLDTCLWSTCDCYNDKKQQQHTVWSAPEQPRDTQVRRPIDATQLRY